MAHLELFWLMERCLPQPQSHPMLDNRVALSISNVMHLSRRSFLLASVSASASASSFLVGQESSSNSRPWRAAVIGHTGRGDYGHGLERIFTGLPGVELVAIADPEGTGRDRVAKSLGEPRQWASWRTMLQRERPQLVSIAMRHADQHAAIALGCLEAGAHVYLEKPFVRSPDEADAVLGLARQRGLTIAVAHTMRFTPIVRRLRAALREGLIGELREIRAYGKQDARAGGEDMMVLGSHLFDLLRLFAGDPLSVTARVLQQGRDLRPDDRREVKDQVGWVAGDQVFAQFAFSGGVNATFTSDARLRETVGHWGLEFHGSRGVARLNCDIAPNAFLRTPAAWATTGRTDQWRPFEPEVAQAPTDHNQAPAADWLAAIRERREPECSGQNGAWAVEMVAGVYRAALEATRIRFPLTERRHPLAPA